MHQDDSQVGTETNVFTNQCGTFIEARAMLNNCKNPTMRTHLKMQTFQKQVTEDVFWNLENGSVIFICHTNFRRQIWIMNRENANLM